MDLFLLISHFQLQDEIRGKKPYTPVKSTVDPKKLKLDGNSGKENQEPRSKENQVKVNFECEKNGGKTRAEGRTKKESALKMPLESKDSNVKAPWMKARYLHVLPLQQLISLIYGGLDC